VLALYLQVSWRGAGSDLPRLDRRDFLGLCRNLFPADHYQGTIGAQCGGTDNCGQNMIASADCLPSAQNGYAGTSWYGTYLPHRTMAPC